MLFSIILNNVRSPVGVEQSPGWFILSPPTVKRVRSFSSLFGLYSHTNLPYVTSRHQSTGISCLVMKKIVSVPNIQVPTPCANHLNSLADECVHASQYFGWVISCLYLSIFPDSSSKIACAVSDMMLCSIMFIAAWKSVSQFRFLIDWNCVFNAASWALALTHVIIDCGGP